MLNLLYACSPLKSYDTRISDETEVVRPGKRRRDKEWMPILNVYF